MSSLCEIPDPNVEAPHRLVRIARLIALVTALVAATLTIGVSPVAAQFGAIRDAARRAAEEKKKADEAKRQADEAKQKAEGTAQPAGTSTPAGAPASAPANAPANAPASAPTSGAAPANANAPSAGGASSAAVPTFQSYSKFDFVPGEKVVAVEDFMQDAVGDFPAKWNTNASGEIVTISGQPGRWLKLTRAGFFTPEFITDIPDNATVELDLAVAPDFNVGFPFEIALVQLADMKQPADWETGPNSFV